MDIEEDAVVPDDLRQVWAAKKHLVISENGTTIDFWGNYAARRGGWTSKYLDRAPLDKVTDAFVVSLLSRRVTSINLAGCENLTNEAIMAIAAKCPALTYLDVLECKNLTTEAIQAIAAKCPSLRSLNVEGCKKLTTEAIQAIAANCPELRSINVGNCENPTNEALEAIAANCPKLTKLVASGCSLTALPTDIGDRLRNLENLDLTDNMLTSLPRSIIKLTKLKRLSLYGNPLQTPPWEIAEKGLDAIRTYFEELDKGESISSLLKVLIIGDGYAGKTTLRNAFSGRSNPHEIDRTIHADIEQVPLSQRLVLNIYDFGGQEEYLAGQLPYITNLALFLLVVEAQYATDKYFENKLERFLLLLHARSPDAVVLLVVSKIDEVSGDPELLCRWLEKKVAGWLEDKRQVAATQAKTINSLRVRPRAFAVSVDRADTTQRLRDEIVQLTEQTPPLLRTVGQRIPTSYETVLLLFGAIVEYGDDEPALQAIRDGTAEKLGETSTLSAEGSYRSRDKLLELWKQCCKEGLFDVLIDDPTGIFDVATELWEAQGLIFVDAGLVYLRPSFVVDVVSALVDHQLAVEMKDVVAFVKNSDELDSMNVDKLRDELERFVECGEIVTWLVLSFLWRNLDLAKEHYSQVLKMLADSGVIFMLESDENDAFAVVLYRLPRQPAPNVRATTWPVSPNAGQREIVLKFQLYLGCPAGLTDCFVSDVHGFGTAMCSWIDGVVVKNRKGPVVCAERVANDIVIKVRFNAETKSEAVAAWKLLADAKALVAWQHAERFPGLFYGARLVCEECLRVGSKPVRDFAWDTKTPKDMALKCDHIFHLGVDGDDVADESVRLPPPVVLIVTTADAEMEAVLDRLEKVPHGYPKAVDWFPVKIGKLGGRVVAVCKTEQGINATYRVVHQLLRSDYLKDSVKLVFAVGFAWGAKPISRGGNQRIGDVLVATKCIEAGHVRASDGDVEIRGTVKTSPLVDSVNSLLCTRWPSETHFGEEKLPDHRPTAHVGTVISLPTLLDDKELTERLIGHPQVVPYKPIVGGDMELYQIADAANETGKQWLLAKAICDFAGLDGKKDKTGQAQAAAAAADIADWLMRQAVMDFLSRESNKNKITR